MKLATARRALLSTATAAAFLLPLPAVAAQNEPGDEQEASEPASGPVEATQVESGEQTVVITGSRIRRTDTTTDAPVTVVDQQSMTDRGFVSASQALNQVTSITPALAISPANGAASGTGQQFPNLFGLGPGRTLTLVNGRRMVTSSSGLGDAQVDANIIPTGLIDRVEIVQAGGAVVYGSDAIAGVINYILMDDFDGIELDGQAGISSRGDYPVYSLRGTVGTNFDDDRGNIAVNVEWARSDQLFFAARPLSALSRITASNAADTGPNDGIPSVREVLDARFTSFNVNGVIFTIPAPVPLPPCGFQICFARNPNGQPLQFSPNGTLIAYDPGTPIGVPFSTGGQGFRFSELASLRTGIERLSGNLLAHYDLSDAITVRTELLYARTEGTETPQYPSRTVLNTPQSNAGFIAFTRNNGFLTPEAIAQLSAASPSFAFGAPLFLSKIFPDLRLTNDQVTTTETWRGLLALEGEFGVGGRTFYWEVSGSYGRVEGGTRLFSIVNSRFNNALNAVRVGSTVVCGINADANPANDDAACVPINPFGVGNISQAAREYVNVESGTDFTNEQIDLLATLGGTIVTLPGGDLGFNIAYEHRDEEAEFVPLPANQQGIIGIGAIEVPQSGSYNTDELSAELLVPIVGGDFTLPFVRALEVNGAYRYVDNSLAGSEHLWAVGGRWEVVDGVTLRASRSRNFRAPTLTQLIAPAVTNLGSIGVDPCDADRINSGPNPAIRRANCLALFQANPGFGVLPDSSNAGASAEARLAIFQDPAENFVRTAITTGGNPDLRNELSDTLTYGIVLQPRFLPGLTFVADRIEVDLEDGLSPFTTADFAAACFDNESPPAGVCEAFTRLANPDGTSPGGTIITGRTTTFNAGVIRFRGEVYNLNYNFSLDSLLGGSNLGRLELALEATHTSLLTTSVTGATFVRSDNTVATPDWVGRFDIRYSNGPFRFTYQLVYRDNVKAGPDATIENNPNPLLDSNTVHNVSTQYDFGGLTLRAGILNLLDTDPSYPNIAHGDILGRQFYVGARVRFR